jgi:hypothetical protein
MIDAHRTQTMRSVHERTRITTLAAERGFFNASSIGSRIRALKAGATLYRQTRTIRRLSIRQSHSFDHFSIRRSLLERKRSLP